MIRNILWLERPGNLSLKWVAGMPVAELVEGEEDSDRASNSTERTSSGERPERYGGCGGS